MIRQSWIEKRNPFWTRLESIVAHSARRGIGALAFREIQELALLYRQVAADLAKVREDRSSARLSEYLNQLLGRAHNLIYMGRRASPHAILKFYGETFPAVFRGTFDYTLLAAAFFVAGALTGFLTCLGDPSFQRYFLGPAMTDTIDHHKMWTHSILAIRPLAASAILTNNLTVSFSTFAFGITGGLGTIYLLMMNGLLLGVISAACWQAGMGLDLWSFIAPHGALELPSVVIAGGAGLLLARGVLFPGSLPRRHALVTYGGQGVRLILGIVPVLMIAGVIEGFCSPMPFPTSAKFALGGAWGLLLVVYLAGCGRAGPRKRRGPRSHPTEVASLPK